MFPPRLYLGRNYGGRMIATWKKMAFCGVCLFVIIFVTVYSTINARDRHKDVMKEKLGDAQAKLQFLEVNCPEDEEIIMTLQEDLFCGCVGNRSVCDNTEAYISSPKDTTAVFDLLKNMPGSRTAAGIYTENILQLRTAFVYQLLPHLMENPDSLKPAYHMRSGRYWVDLVVGVPTLKRDQESFLIFTLTNLVSGLTRADVKSILIVVMIGETDLEFIITTARKIELTFPDHVENGLIEVLSPSAAYYPNYDTLLGTMEKSREKVKRRAKQNLDSIYLMAYAQSRGVFYLTLEDAVIAKKNYIQEIMKFTISISVANRNWFYIDYCHVGGIGRLFRSADLIHFITYVQLFYKYMPIEWLLDSYLADKICIILKNRKNCSLAKEARQPKYKSPVFQHIGHYSTLEKNNQYTKDMQATASPKFYPHTSNPPLQYLKTDIAVRPGYSLQAAYDGVSFFWGEKPKKGNTVEFWFEKPIVLDRYTFRSGNVEHIEDKFYDTTVEVLPARGSIPYTPVNTFNEFGLAQGRLAMGNIAAVRLRVTKNSKHKVILSVIEFAEYQPPATAK